MRLRAVSFCVFLVAGLVAFAQSDRDRPEAERLPRVTVFRSPTCGCCTKWADHLRENGFPVQVTEVTKLDDLKRRQGVPEHSYACHTALVDGYVVEGHVPASDIRRLLHERPSVTGLVVPGMPRGSPGMEGPTSEPYTVYTFDESGQRSFFSKYE